jgi:hypothetical protein
VARKLGAAPPDPRTSRRRHHILGAITIGAGAALIATSAYFAWDAQAKWSDAQGHCTPGNVCSSTGSTLVDDAHTSATIATIVGGAGLAALATGVIVYLTAPKLPVERPSVDLVPRAGGASLQIGGRF